MMAMGIGGWFGIFTGFTTGFLLFKKWSFRLFMSMVGLTIGLVFGYGNRKALMGVEINPLVHELDVLQSMMKRRSMEY